MKKFFFILGLIWTVNILVQFACNLFTCDVNYFGIFFAIPLLIFAILFGNCILFICYLLVNWKKTQINKGCSECR